MTTMNITKSNWTTDGDTFSVTMPMSKVDKENRLVSGWASLDNVDLQGDVVKADASVRAFQRFRGNIREMHQPIAAGRMVSYKPDTYYDAVTKKFYNGIFVTAYVSKGAESTWEKVLDGTLSAFSIKGPIIDSEMEFSKDAGRPVRIVKDYDLEELSLVDSGGNQLANVVSFQKSVDGTLTVTGMVADTKSENVFYCERHDSPVAKTSAEDNIDCLEGHKMVNIGWIEYDETNKAAKVEEVIAKYNSTQNNAEQEIPATNEGGVDVADTDKTEEVAPETDPTTTGDTQPVGEQGKAQNEVESSNGVADNAEVQAPEETVEKAADVSDEVQVEKPDVADLFADLKSTVVSGLEKSTTDTQEAIKAVTESFDAKVSDLASKFDSLQAELAGVKKSVEAVESETAFKKSGDLGGSTEDTLEKSNGRKGTDWAGIFSSPTRTVY